MSFPKDYQENNRTGFVRIARVYSDVVSPPVMFALVGLALALHERPFLPGLAWAVVYAFIVSLLPIVAVLYFLQTGRISDLHMSNTHERHLPYAIAVLCAVIAFLLISWLQGPALLRCLALFNIVELLALALINVVWLISIHATGITATMMIVGLVFGWGAGLFIVPLVLSVAYVRLYLRRHTPAQVLAGFGLGTLSVYSLTWVNCFV